MNTVEELKTQKANLETDFNSKIAAAERFQLQIANLQKQVDLVEDQLVTIESRRAYAVKRIEELRDFCVHLWHRPDTDVVGAPNVSAFNDLATAHASIHSLTSVVAEFPKIKAALLAKLKQAQAELGRFQATQR
jgi:hypothetical protein